MIPVIIPFYKNRRQLKKCKVHLKRQTTKVNIWVKDNSVNNEYFTGGVNKGLKHFLPQDCPYIIIIDQDMYLAPDAVGWMVRFMDKHPDCGIGTPQVELINDGRISGGGAAMYPFGCYISRKDSGRFINDAPLFWAESTCWILRKEMVVEIGLLDANYKVLFMDSDYCLTARSRGWQVWRIANAIGKHERNQSLKSTTMTKEKKIDKAYFEEKWINSRPFNLFGMLNFRKEGPPTPRINIIDIDVDFLKQFCLDINARHILELGVRAGHSTCAFLSAIKSKKGKLVSIDIDDCSDVFNSPDWEFHRMNDLDFDTNAQFDIIFIDTSHTYDQTLAELRKFAPNLKKNGAILLHDTISYPPVSQAIQAYLKENPNKYECANHRGFSGIGILRLKEQLCGHRKQPKENKRYASAVIG